MQILFVPRVVMVNLIVSKEYVIYCFGKQVWEMNKFMDNTTMLKSCRSLSFSTPNSWYKLFTGVFMFLNCRVLKILFCVTINGCINFFVVFT